MSTTAHHRAIRMDDDWIGKFRQGATTPEPTIAQYVSLRNPNGTEYIAALILEVDRRFPDELMAQLARNGREAAAAYKPRGGPCRYCRQPVPEYSRYARFCSDSCERFERRRKAGYRTRSVFCR